MNKKNPTKYVINKRKAKESLGHLLNGEGDLIMDETEKAKVFDGFFPFVFMNKVSYQMMSTASSKDPTQPRVGKQEVRDNLEKLDIFKAAAPDGRHSRHLDYRVSAFPREPETMDLLSLPSGICLETSAKNNIWSLLRFRKLKQHRAQ